MPPSTPTRERAPDRLGPADPRRRRWEHGSVWVLMALGAADLTVAVGGLHALRGPLVLPVALLLPGWLTLGLISTEGRGRSGWEAVVWSLGLSIAWMFVVGLVLVGLPAVGHKLSTDRTLVALNVIVVALLIVVAAAAARRADPGPKAQQPESPRRPRWPRPAPGVLAGPVLAAAAAILAAAGAERLNSGGSPALAAAALSLGAVALVVRAQSQEYQPGADAATVYLVGLAVLLEISLRGAGISGHDISSEYRLFLSTARSGTWSPGGPIPGYNACLSITILPTVVLRLSGIAAPDVFRVVFQLVFAAAGPIVYALSRRLLGRRPAVLAAGLFIAFPTYVNDMAWITRQEIAFVFFALAGLAVVDRERDRRGRVALFLVSGLAMVVSHYSTTYVAVWMFAVATLALAVRDRRPSRPRAAADRVLTIPVVAVVALCAVGWGAWTGTARGLTSTVTTTLSDLSSGGGIREAATGYSLIVSPTHLSPEQALSRFVAEQRAHDHLAPATPQAQCRVTVLAAGTTPVSLDGRSLGRTGLDAGSVVGWLRAATVALFEVGALAGLWALWRRPPRRRAANLEAGLLAVAVCAVMAAVVVLPEVSVSYGLLRVYQQALVLLAPLVVLGCINAASRLTSRWADGVVAGVVAGVFLVTSGVVPQALGGYPAQLNMNNRGPVYDAYYVAPPDRAAAAWVQGHRHAGSTILTDLAGATILTDLDGATVLQSETTVPFTDALYPGLVPPAALVVARVTPERAVRATAVYDDQIISYTFPVSCLGAGRRVLFRDGDRVVLGPAVSRA